MLLACSPEESFDFADAVKLTPAKRAAESAVDPKPTVHVVFEATEGVVCAVGDPFKDEASVADDPKELSLEVPIDSPSADAVDALSNSAESFPFPADDVLEGVLEGGLEGV